MSMTVDRVDGIEPHCETTRLNSHCPYIALGCKGCESAVLRNLIMPTAKGAVALYHLGITDAVMNRAAAYRLTGCLPSHDGKQVSLINRSSKRKKSVGGKRWRR